MNNNKRSDCHEDDDVDGYADVEATGCKMHGE